MHGAWLPHVTHACLQTWSWQPCVGARAWRALGPALRCSAAGTGHEALALHPQVIHSVCCPFACVPQRTAIFCTAAVEEPGASSSWPPCVVVGFQSGDGGRMSLRVTCTSHGAIGKVCVPCLIPLCSHHTWPHVQRSLKRVFTTRQRCTHCTKSSCVGNQSTYNPARPHGACPAIQALTLEACGAHTPTMLP